MLTGVVAAYVHMCEFRRQTTIGKWQTKLSGGKIMMMMIIVMMMMMMMVMMTIMMMTMIMSKNNQKFPEEVHDSEQTRLSVKVNYIHTPSYHDYFVPWSVI